MYKRKSVLAAMVGLCFTAGIGAAVAGEAEQDKKARQGTVRCGGTHSTAHGGTEIQWTNYVFRNLNSTTPITIKRLVMFDALGNVLVDSNLNGFPPFDNGVLGPADNILDANQTASLTTLGMAPLPPTQRPIQLEIEWTAPEKALTLDVSVVRPSNRRDPATGQIFEERARHLRDCRTISFKD
ncbi:MAG: hypothetical protein ACK4N4_02695 [Burkholderiales bacterium]